MARGRLAYFAHQADRLRFDEQMDAAYSAAWPTWDKEGKAAIEHYFKALSGLEPAPEPGVSYADSATAAFGTMLPRLHRKPKSKLKPRAV